jgi:hypothetical protein
MPQALALRELLQAFALSSRPVRVSSEMNKKDIAESERVYRPTFCRFIIDSNLCAYVDAQYHYIVRLFDVLATTTEGQDKQPRKFAAAGSASIDTCMSVICYILGHSATPNQAASNFFDSGMEAARVIVEALREETKDRQIAAVKLAAEEKEADANDEKHKEFMKLLGSPPKFFSGSLREWSTGSRMWIKTLAEQSEPDIIAERAEQSFALECYLSDQLCEPSCLSACEQFAGLFEGLFNAYWDEERTTYEGRTARQAKHMSCAGFFSLLH